MSNGRSSSKKSYFHFIAGLASGTSTAILLQPADLLKTRVQQSRSSSLTSTVRDIFSSPAPLRQLWRGTLPSAIRTGAGSALYFGSLNMLRTAAARSPLNNSTSSNPSSSSSSSALPRLSSTGNLMTGALARTAAGLVLMPVTVIKVRYESDLYGYRSMGGAARDILRTEGPRGFVAGFGATAARDAPYAGLYVLFYEECKRRLGALADRSRTHGAALASAARGEVAVLPTTRTDPSRAIGGGGGGTSLGSAAMAVNFASGVAAAGAATALTNPFDTIKTRIQLMPQRYANMFVAARTILRDEGVRSLFDGLALRMARKAISSALAWTVYEELIRRAEVRWAEEKGML